MKYLRFCILSLASVLMVGCNKTPQVNTNENYKVQGSYTHGEVRLQSVEQINNQPRSQTIQGAGTTNTYDW